MNEGFELCLWALRRREPSSNDQASGHRELEGGRHRENNLRGLLYFCTLATWHFSKNKTKYKWRTSMVGTPWHEDVKCWHWFSFLCYLLIAATESTPDRTGRWRFHRDAFVLSEMVIKSQITGSRLLNVEQEVRAIEFRICLDCANTCVCVVYRMWHQQVRLKQPEVEDTRDALVDHGPRQGTVCRSIWNRYPVIFIVVSALPPHPKYYDSLRFAKNAMSHVCLSFVSQRKLSWRRFRPHWFGREMDWGWWLM